MQTRTWILVCVVALASAGLGARAILKGQGGLQYRTEPVEHGDSLAQLRILADEAQITDRAVKDAQRSLEISTVQYRGGLANYLQVITAQTSALENQRAAVDILTRRMVSSVSLVQALGGGWDASQLPTSRELRATAQTRP